MNFNVIPADNTGRIAIPSFSIQGQKVLRHFGGNLRGKRIAIWGLGCKADTDDICDSPALALIDVLLAAGAQIAVSDPMALQNVRQVFGDEIDYETNKWNAAQNADALVIITACKQFTGIDVGALRWRLIEPTVFDCCNCLNESDLELGLFTHYQTENATKATLPNGSSAPRPQVNTLVAAC